MREEVAGRSSQLWGLLAAALAAAMFIVDAFLPVGRRPWIALAGVAVLTAALPLMFLPFWYLRRHGGVPRRRAYWETTVLVERGPYGLVRHPQYLGYCLLVAGFALTSQHPLTAALAAAAAFGFYRQAVAEESRCRQVLGEAYERYAGQVPRFDIVEGIRRRWSRGA